MFFLSLVPAAVKKVDERLQVLIFVFLLPTFLCLHPSGILFQLCFLGLFNSHTLVMKMLQVDIQSSERLCKNCFAQ